MPDEPTLAVAGPDTSRERPRTGLAADSGRTAHGKRQLRGKGQLGFGFQATALCIQPLLHAADRTRRGRSRPPVQALCHGKRLVLYKLTGGLGHVILRDPAFTN